MPRMVMDVTMNNQDGKELFSSSKIYTVNDLYFKNGKKVPMAEWDITATEHYDLGLKALETDRRTFIVPVPAGTQSVDVSADLKYLYSSDRTIDMADVQKHVIINW
jgi:hypothetical protein